MIVVEPKKIDEKNKKTNIWGTYLRYKRIWNYDNENKILNRIRFFKKNYDVDDKQIIKQLWKEFNITEKTWKQFMWKFNDKNKNVLKRSWWKNKNTLEFVKFKNPGIGIEILGKKHDNQKVKFIGIKNMGQLHKIYKIINIFITIYIELHIFKHENNEFTNLHDMITNITKRNPFNEIVIVNKNKKDKIWKNDVNRLGFKPLFGQNQWWRMCQKTKK